MPHQSINPPDLFNSVQYGFSQIVVAEGSRLVFISGQVGWDADETPVVGLAAQTTQALANLRTAIEAAGGTLADIAALRVYFRIDQRDDLEPITVGLQTAFPSDPPTATWVGVPSLARENILVEIEATAVLA